MADLTSNEYKQVIDLISKYYGTSSNGIVSELNKYSDNIQNPSDLFSLLPEHYKIIYNADGSIRNYTAVDTAVSALSSEQQVASEINSNVGSTLVKEATKVDYQIPIQTATETAGTATKTTFSTVAGTAGNIIFGKVVPAVAAASAGITLGKLIDKGIYEVGTNIFGADNLEAFNPDTWGTLTEGDNSLRAKAFNTIFGINPNNGKTQQYMDENALAYLTAYMGANGFFDVEYEYELENKSMLWHPNIDYKVTPIYTGSFEIPRKNGGQPSSFVISNNASEVVCKPAYEKGGNDAYYTFYSRNNFTLTTSAYTFNPYTTNARQVTLKDGSVIYAAGSNFSVHIPDSIINFDYFPHDKKGNLLSGLYYNQYADDCSFIALFGEKTNIAGIPDQNDAKQFDKTNISDWNDISSVLNVLKEQYPDLWNNAISETVVQPDGSTKTYTYVPVATPNFNPTNENQPTIGNSTQADPVVDPDTMPADSLAELIKVFTSTPTDTKDDTGDGKTPVVIPPTGSANALFAIYNPTEAQIKSFGAWLWSANFIDQLKKMFNDPSEAIIGLHKVFVTPITGAEQNIKVGYLDSGVASKIVTNQYVTIDCGTITLAEFFGNVFDYSPFTDVSLYLPFIGIVKLNNADVLRSTINIVYHADVINGSVLAEVKVNRDGAGGTLYQYTGNCAVQYPLSSGSYMGMITGALSLTLGVATAVATKGVAPALLGAGAGLGRMHNDVERSGGFAGNAGAMGIKKPYLIISRPQTELADKFTTFVGKPSNYTTTIGACKGFTKVDTVHIENVDATSSELDELNQILTNGILV